MSENRNHPGESPRDETLESLLRKLEPSAPRDEFVDELLRDQRRIADFDRHAPTTPQWKRLIPLALAGCLAFACYVAFQYRPVFQGEKTTTARAAETPVARGSSAADTPRPGAASPPPARSSQAGVPSGSFQPVSAQGYLVDSESGGVVETENGPRERMNLEFRDAYHWHDPRTGTNIRLFRPRNEEVVVPLQTD